MPDRLVYRFSFEFKGTQRVTFDLPPLSPQMDLAFQRFYTLAYTEPEADLSFFVDEATSFLQTVPRQWGTHDDFFGGFSPLWREFLNNGNLVRALWVWAKALSVIGLVEAASGQRFHKGTPYYFAGVTALLAGDLDRGFIFMHRGLAEDSETHSTDTPPTPTCKFAVLDGDHPAQAFKDWVSARSDFLKLKVQQYNVGHERSLEPQTFRETFMLDPAVREAVFLFSFCLARFERAIPDLRGETGTFATQYVGNVLFDLCTVIEAAAGRRAPSVSKNFIDHLSWIAKRSGLIVAKKLQALGTEFERDFDRTLTNCLTETMVAGGERLSGLNASVAVCYGIRNRFGHRPEASASVARFANLLVDRVLDVLFLTVEFSASERRS